MAHTKLEYRPKKLTDVEKHFFKEIEAKKFMEVKTLPF